MTSRYRVPVACGILLWLALYGRASAAEVALEPIQCWWRTSAGAVQVGERFTIVLTCSVVDTASTTVVADQSRLDPAVVRLAPFEVVGGARAPDSRTATRSFLQYEYTLRYVGEDFGKDVATSSLTIPYRVQSRTQGGNAAVEGRQRQYILPAQVIRILSLVPTGGTDIRDQPAETSGGIAARRFRANLLRIAAGSMYLFGALVAIVGFTRAFRQRQPRAPAVAGIVSDGAILRRVLEELARVRRESAIEGWTDGLAAPALAALRVVASYALSRPVSRVPHLLTDPSDGQLEVPGQWAARRSAAYVSSSVTPAALAGSHPDLEAALKVFAGKVYGRTAGAIDDTDLDAALDVGLREADRLRREHGWMVKTRAAAVATLNRLGPRSWAR